jgi:hypothetical protein
MKSLINAGLLAIGLASSLVAPAQTTAAGPYYAMPSWDQKLPTATRFIVLSNWDDKAVLDRETGLVWERDPLHARNVSLAYVPFSTAISLCVQSDTGGRSGWRLPSISELQSLYDRSGESSGIRLPIGHPFQNIQDLRAYWSSTITGTADGAFAQGFSIRGSLTEAGKTYELGMWCVRGPGGGSYN